MLNNFTMPWKCSVFAKLRKLLDSEKLKCASLDVTRSRSRRNPTALRKCTSRCCCYDMLRKINKRSSGALLWGLSFFLSTLLHFLIDRRKKEQQILFACRRCGGKISCFKENKRSCLLFSRVRYSMTRIQRSNKSR